MTLHDHETALFWEIPSAPTLRAVRVLVSISKKRRTHRFLQQLHVGF